MHFSVKEEVRKHLESNVLSLYDSYINKIVLQGTKKNVYLFAYINDNILILYAYVHIYYFI